jgi:hypothetical protein
MEVKRKRREREKAIRTKPHPPEHPISPKTLYAMEEEGTEKINLNPQIFKIHNTIAAKQTPKQKAIASDQKGPQTKGL